MADENEESEDLDGEDEEESGNKNRKIIFIFGGVVALLIIGGSAAFFMGYLDSLLGRPTTAAEIELPPPAPLVNFELPRKKADLKTGTCRAPFLQYQIILEVSVDYTKEIEELTPKLMDAYQVFLRDQRREDLSGAKGAEMLRRELANITNKMIKPHRIESVIFKQFILQ